MATFACNSWEYAVETLRILAQINDAMNSFLKPIKERRKYYEEHPDAVDKILSEGTNIAREKAKEQIKKVRKAKWIR